MSKMIYAIFLVVGTMISGVCAEDRYYRTEGDLSSEEIKEVIKNDLQEKRMRSIPLGKEQFANDMLSTLNKTLDNMFDFSASFQDYLSSFEFHQSKVEEAELHYKELQQVLANYTTYLADNNLDKQYSLDFQKHMTALKEPIDVRKLIFEKLLNDEIILKFKQKKIDEKLNEIRRIIHDNTSKVRVSQRKVLIFESKLTGETVSTECIADENDAILKQKFYGSSHPGLTGIEVFLQSGKTLTCGTKDQPLFSEISLSENLSKLRVKNSGNYYINEIEFHDKNGQKKTTGSFHRWGDWLEYQIQPEERLIGYSGYYFKSGYQMFKTLYMVLEKCEYY